MAFAIWVMPYFTHPPAKAKKGSGWWGDGLRVMKGFAALKETHSGSALALMGLPE